MLSVLKERLRREASQVASQEACQEEPDTKHDPVSLAPTGHHLRWVEAARDQDRTDFFQEIADHCDLTMKGVAWRFSRGAEPVFTLNHPMAPDPAMECAFPLRDPADPRHVHPRFAAPDGRLAPGVTVRDVRPLAAPLNALMKLVGVPDALHLQLREALTADVWQEMERLIQGRPTPPPYEVRRLRAEDLQAHEMSLVNQHGLFGWSDQAPDQRPTLENGRVLGLFVGALLENDQQEALYAASHPGHNSYMIEFKLQDGRLAGLTGLGAANGPSFANTALLPGAPARYDHARLNAHLMPFHLRLTGANGKPSRATVVALITTAAAYGPGNPTREIRADYGPRFLKEFDDQQAAHESAPEAAHAQTFAGRVTVKPEPCAPESISSAPLPKDLAALRAWCRAASAGEYRDVARRRMTKAFNEAAEVLDLSGLGLLELPPLTFCAQVCKLDLSGNRLTQVSGLSALVLLVELDLRGNALSAMPELRSPLRRLHLGDNPGLSALASGEQDQTILVCGHACVIVGVAGRYRTVQIARPRSANAGRSGIPPKIPWQTALLQENPRRIDESRRAYSIRLVLADAQWTERNGGEALHLLWCVGETIPRHVFLIPFKPVLAELMRRYPQITQESDISYARRLVALGAEAQTIRHIFRLTMDALAGSENRDDAPHHAAAKWSGAGVFRNLVKRPSPVQGSPVPAKILLQVMRSPVQARTTLRPLLPAPPGGSRLEGLTLERRNQLIQAVGVPRHNSSTAHALRVMIEAHRLGWTLTVNDLMATSYLHKKECPAVKRFCSVVGVMKILSSHPPNAMEHGVDYLKRLIADAGLPPQACEILGLWRRMMNRRREVAARKLAGASTGDGPSSLPPTTPLPTTLLPPGPSGAGPSGGAAP